MCVFHSVIILTKFIHFKLLHYMSATSYGTMIDEVNQYFSWKTTIWVPRENNTLNVGHSWIWTFPYETGGTHFVLSLWVF